MKDTRFGTKQQAILTSAWQAFATYGFRKTSMDDIAKGAGVSRPALYQHYRNKEDIFRSLVQHYYDEVTVLVEAELEKEGGVATLLTQALQQQGEKIAELLESPHGMELMDAGTTTAADIVEAGEKRLQGIYADWLDREVARGRAKLTGPSGDIAAMITNSLKGIKSYAPDHDSYNTRVLQLALLVGAGLQVR